MRYWIPTEMQIGNKKYVVQQHEKLGNGYDKGVVDVKAKRIELGKKDVAGSKFSAEERYETLFHEMTHAILYEMNHPLWRDEKFVNRFAKHLTDAICTAR